MVCLKRCALAVALAAFFVSSGEQARAGELPQPLSPPKLEEASGWYLRGDIGMSNQALRRVETASFADLAGFEWVDRGGFDSGPTFGLGVGYRYESWLRWDLTGEYRGSADFGALAQFGGGANEYSASSSAWLFLWNAYVDLGTWHSITPFIGGGVGAAYNTISHFRATGDAPGFAGAASKWDLAWALYAGLAYDVTPNFTIELVYRYLNMGDAAAGMLLALDGTCTTCQAVQFRSITSHDVRFGARWLLADMGTSAWQPPAATRN